MKVDQQEFAKMTIDEIKEKFPKMSKEDFDFHFPKKKILDFENENINLIKYESLVQKKKDFINYNFQNPMQVTKKLSSLELVQMANFESKSTLNPESFKNAIAYWDKIQLQNEKNMIFNEGMVPDKKTLYKLFLKAYKHLNSVDFILTDESIKNLEPIIKYFSFENTFADSENLIKKCGNKNLSSSFKKGLLLIGNVGNGKTSIMKSMEFLIDFYLKKSIEEKWDTAGDWAKIRFRFSTTESLVSEFEYLQTQEEKDIFFKNQSTGNLFLDDLKREKNASNYGITNVIGSVLEKRYNHFKSYTSENKTKTFVTHGTMNFHEKHPNDINLAIQDCGLRYGSHVYDRFFELFNIIEIKGKSFRK